MNKTKRINVFNYAKVQQKLKQEKYTTKTCPEKNNRIQRISSQINSSATAEHLNGL